MQSKTRYQNAHEYEKMHFELKNKIKMSKKDFNCKIHTEYTKKLLVFAKKNENFQSITQLKYQEELLFLRKIKHKINMTEKISCSRVSTQYKRTPKF